MEGRIKFGEGRYSLDMRKIKSKIGGYGNGVCNLAGSIPVGH
jgi:hypothetical protein